MVSSMVDNVPVVPIHIGHGTGDHANRRTILDMLLDIPGFLQAAKALSPSETFRAVMSAENAYLFKQAADGTYKPFLREGGKFVENVDLIQVSPDYAAALSDLALRLNMVAVAARLEAIRVEVANLALVFANVVRGQVSASTQRAVEARHWSSPLERREEFRSASGVLRVAIGELIGQLDAHLKAMPEAQTGWLDGFFGDNLKVSATAFDEVDADLKVLSEAIAVLLRTYDILDEPAVARAALLDISSRLSLLDLKHASQKALLVPFKGGLSPEQRLAKFDEALSRLAVFSEQQVLAPVSVSVDLTYEEIIA